MGKRLIKLVRPLSSDEEWTPFVQLPLDVIPEQREAGYNLQAVLANNLYKVMLRPIASAAFRDREGQPMAIMHMTVQTREERQPAPTWEHLQRIKEEIMGPHVEAMELFPNAERDINIPDRHLWCFPEGVMIPVGFEPEVAVLRPEGVDADGNPVVRRVSDDEMTAADAEDVPVAPMGGVAAALQADDETAARLAEEVTERAAADDLARIREEMRKGR
jgi:hypothetical protein